jgi:predicted RecA/RadA family phage recombinase
MAVQFVQVGQTINYSNAGDAISAGDVVVMGTTLGIALVDIAATTGTGAVAIEGVFSGVPKVSAAVFAQGEKLLLDVSATPDAFDDSSATPATGDILGAAIAWVAGANLETTCTIKLTPGNATKT